MLLIFRVFAYKKGGGLMKPKYIFVLILWLILLAITITLLAIGIKPKDLIGEFLGLASPLIVFLTSR